jgi:ABC-type Mn2+/Zn2+ transport system permease subunit
MRKLKINHLAVIAGTLFHMVFPMIWFSPFLMGTQWMALNKFTMEDIQKNSSPVPYIIALAGALLCNYLMAITFRSIKVENAAKGLQWALTFALGFMFMEFMVSDQFSMRPIELTLINAGMFLTNFLVSGIILGAWRKYTLKY